MYRRRLAHMILATLCLASCLTFFGACMAIVHAHAQERSLSPSARTIQPE